MRAEADVPEPLAALHAAFRSLLYLPDPSVVDVALATVVAHRHGGDPVWTLIIGPPAGGKTEVIQSVTDLPEVHALSSLTSQTFASGLRGRGQRVSLLHRLDTDAKSFLTLKDFTTVLSMHREARAEIIAQLRELHDGSYTKEFGTGETVAWSGRLGLLAGVTPVIDSHHSVMALLGERFVHYRLPPIPRREVSRRALGERGREPGMRVLLRQLVREFVDGVPRTPTELSLPMLERLAALADFATWARSGVERDPFSTREIVAVPQPEAPARFVKQAAAIAAALLAMGYGEESAAALVLRVAYDCIPPARLRTLILLSAADSLTTPEIAESIELPTSTARRHVEDLAALGLVVRTPGPGGRGGADRWSLSDDGRATWGASDPSFGAESHPRSREPTENGPSTSPSISPSLPLDDFSGTERAGR